MLRSWNWKRFSPISGSRRKNRKNFWLNIAHAAMELPAETAGQYVILPALIVIGLVLAWHSIKYVRES